MLRRERLETQRMWQKRLRAIEGEVHAEWGPDARRRLANVAAATSRDWLHDQLRTPQSPYRLDAQKQPVARQEEIDERVPDGFFDFGTDNGIQDKKIVVEAFAGGYHLLVSNSIGSIGNRPNIHLLSTVAFLRGMERQGFVHSASDLIEEMQHPTKPGRATLEKC